MIEGRNKKKNKKRIILKITSHYIFIGIYVKELFLYAGTEASLKSIHYNVGEAGSLFFSSIYFYGIIDKWMKMVKKELVLHDESRTITFLGAY